MQCACMRSVLRVLQPSTQEQMCRQVTRAGCAYMTSLSVSWLRAFFYLLRVSRFCVLFFKKRTFLDTCQRPSHLYSYFIFSWSSPVLLQLTPLWQAGGGHASLLTLPTIYFSIKINKFLKTHSLNLSFLRIFHIFYIQPVLKNNSGVGGEEKCFGFFLFTSWPSRIGRGVG